MFFPKPPKIGEIVKLRTTGMLAEICQIDHYRMVIEVLPLPVAELVG
ncbi:MAG: hypothetical protein AAGC93_04665 [Cyanobacteria bacterium P01_F01_bin.53]